MSNTIYEESLCVDKSFISTSTSYRFIHTTSSKFYNDSSLVPIFCNRSSTNLGVRKVSSSIHKLDYGVFKLKDSSNVKDPVAFCAPLISLNQEPSKKLSLISCFRMQMNQSNSYPKYDFKFSKSKNLNLYKSIYHKRINLEGQIKVDFMYYLSKRYNFVPVTEKIFSFMYGKDILAMSMVSKAWHNAIKYSPSAKQKKKMYVTYMQSEKENHGHVEQRRFYLKSRRVLSDISNIMRFPLK
ncbi:uncharacterized protein LOC112599478 [Melanaphis sacchari]|uniref:uncharacterized protein LOC112599478 n=1 Tax=Melanaphis sacchari TaxID=742174 RepID=UPI000DC141A3|nr:uncharacterized protein LOC112599478 [Melanaphis sacchari]XP_025202181.1 uncharacterized protein LOC112599478 [Melanaphis sacchari]